MSFFMSYNIKCPVPAHHARWRKELVAMEEGEAVETGEFELLAKVRLMDRGERKLLIEFVRDSQKKYGQMGRKENERERLGDGCGEEEPLYVPTCGVSSGENRGYKLASGLTIKLGRVELFVREMRVNGDKTVSQPKNRKWLKHLQAATRYKEPNAICKICFEEERESSNPLINPCKCSGSCGSVHFQCMLEWIRLRTSQRLIGPTLHYDLSKFQCEVCKSELPFKLQITDKKAVELVPMQRPEGSYLILESRYGEDKNLFVISALQGHRVNLGRASDCQISLKDISISRVHASIRYIDNQFYIFDNNSKFGTLVSLERRSLEVNRHSPKTIQIGRSVIKFDLGKEESRVNTNVSSSRNCPGQTRVTAPLVFKAKPKKTIANF